ncbi:MAG: ATP-dependent RecD-like DNA helicase [Oscillospiraceae bacterium]|nr:ATP-dependent RecD-like DNA helicase [Oscillospiraceae bacterium]
MEHHDDNIAFSGADTVSGRVVAIVFQSEDTGYTVLRLDVGGDEVITAVGSLPFLAPGEILHAEGGWMTHPTHGEQFKIAAARRELPRTEQAVYDFLASRTIRGIGPRTAQAIVDRFGADALEIIEAHPEQLTNLKGFSLQKAREVGQAVRRQAALRLLIDFLTRHEMPVQLSIRLYAVYGDNASAAVKDDPYLLADPRFGGDFHLADTLALSLGVDGDSPRRLMAACLFTLEHNLNNGHCFIPRNKLVPATARLLDVPVELCDDAVDKLIEAGRVVESTLRGLAVCYLDYLYEAEENVSARIRQLAAFPTDGSANIPALLRQVEEDTGLTYAPEQREAVAMAAERHVLVLTGAPGTGKTTAVRAILALFDRLGLRTLLAAPTGRAAKRMSELTGKEASTIHRLLGACYAEGEAGLVFDRDASNPLEADAVVLDETSMVDILLAEALIAALPSGCRLVLVGDADQLPSVGPGNFFSDLIRSGAVPVVRLTEIFRQAKESAIICNAHAINEGVMPDLKQKQNDFFFLQRASAIQTVDTVMDLVARRLPENMQLPPQDIQVLSPFKKGEAGTINLNRRLQEALNPRSPDRPERRFDDWTLREGDKVMQIRNNYGILWKQEDGTNGQGVFNGDIGRIVSVDAKEGSATVDYDGRLVVYAPEELLELEHAFAMTVHKSQGSEYRAVVYVTQHGPPMLLNRTVLYTGVTRAKELLILVGDGGVVSTMITNDKQQQRYSGLKLRLAGE